MRLALVALLAVGCGRVGFDTSSVPDADPALGTTCRNVGAAADGVYSIDPDGPGGNAPFAGYCNATYDGGGWTLVMRFAADAVLDYDSPYWTDPALLLNENGSLLPTDTTNAKFRSFGSVPGTTLLGCNGGVPSISDCIARSLSGSRTAQATFGGGPDAGGISRSSLDGIFGDNATCPYCDTGGGINYTNYNEYVRLGTIGDFDPDCGTPDASWGWGIRDDYDGRTCGAGKVGRGLATADCRQATLWIR